MFSMVSGEIFSLTFQLPDNFDQFIQRSCITLLFHLHRMQISKISDHDEFYFCQNRFLPWDTRWELTAVVALLFYQ